MRKRVTTHLEIRELIAMLEALTVELLAACTHIRNNVGETWAAEVEIVDPVASFEASLS